MPSTVPSGPRLDSGICHGHKRIADILALLDAVAAPARVNEVGVVSLQVGAKPLWLKVVDIEITRDLSPCFPFQAIHAPKDEFVTQPRAIRFISSIAGWRMPTMAAGIRVIEDQSEASSGSSIPSNCRWSRLAPARGTISSVSKTDRNKAVR